MDERPDRIVIDGCLIDESLLETMPITRCRIADCKASCCTDGVWVAIEQANRILEHADMIAPFMPPERRNRETWFAEAYNDPSAFPPGEYIGTTTVADSTHPIGQTCVFLRPEDRYCAIQAASLVNGLRAWELKPFYCCLFPLVDGRTDDGLRELTLDKENSLFEHGGGCSASSATQRPVFQVYAEETAMALGVEGYRELCRRVSVAPSL
jgi:Fe-S-cluster containining protein